jgi:hypothetical protein
MVWKEAAAYFRVLSQHLSEGAKENNENITQDRQSPGQDSNLEPPEYKVGMQTITLQHSV